MIFSDDIYIGGYADLKGVVQPLTLHMSSGQAKGGLAACAIVLSVGLLIDYSTDSNPKWDRIAGIFYYCATVSMVALLGWSRPIQQFARGMDTGGSVNGAAIATCLAFVAHVLMISVMLTGVDALSVVRNRANKLLGVGARGRDEKINKKILIGFSAVALTLPLSAGTAGFLLGKVATVATFGVFTVSNIALAFVGVK